MSTAYLGIGSNLGDRQANIDAALQRLKDIGVNVNKVATIIETDPVGGPPQDRYLNSVCEIETELSPRALLAVVKTIEKDLGRDADGVRNGPREIDLDILIYDDLVLDAADLTIPHPRMRERDFVMRPLKEIAPDVAERIFRAAN